MSRLRNRNIQTKILTVAKWGRNSHKIHEIGTTTADSGTEEIAPKLKQQQPHYERYSNWNPREHDEDDPPEDEDSSNSNHSASSVNTLKVFDEIQNLEDSVKTNSAESYNSWADDYETTATELVKAEYERMERVLQCRETVPANYDKDEFNLWIKTFPSLSLGSSSQKNQNQLISSPKFCDNDTPTPSSILSRTNSRHLRSLDKLLDDLHPPKTKTTPFHSTTFTNSKGLAINNTINPRTLNIKIDHSFLQLAPLNLPTKRHSFNSNKPPSIKQKHKSSASSYSASGRNTVEWLTDDFRRTSLSTVKNGIYERYRPRRKSSKTTEPIKSTSEFIVLPPIEGKEMRSASAATVSSNNVKIPVKLHNPVYPLYENDQEGDHHDGFVSYRHRKRKYK